MLTHRRNTLCGRCAEGIPIIELFIIVPLTNVAAVGRPSACGVSESIAPLSGVPLELLGGGFPVVAVVVVVAIEHSLFFASSKRVTHARCNTKPKKS